MFHSFASAEPKRDAADMDGRPAAQPTPPKLPRTTDSSSGEDGAAAAQPTPQKQPRATDSSSDSSSDDDVDMGGEDGVFDPANSEHQQRLWDAVQDEDKSYLRNIVGLEGFDVNMVFSQIGMRPELKGMTLLCVAMSEDWDRQHILSNMDILLAQPGIKVNKKCLHGPMRGVTPLVYAIMKYYEFEWRGGVIVTRLLGDRRVDVNLECTAGPRKGTTPLIIAIQKYQEDICRLLLARDDIDVNKVTTTNVSALDAALRANDYKIMDLMMGREDIQVTQDIFVHAFIDLEGRDVRYFGQLLSHLENNNWDASWLERIFPTAWLASEPKGLDRTTAEELRIAVRMRKLKEKMKTKYDTLMWPSICFADTPRIFDDVWRLHPFDLGSRAQELAEDAVVYGSILVFRKLLDRGINVNYIIVGNHGPRLPLLSQACARAHLNIVLELLKPQYHCDVNATSFNHNDSALHFAVDNLNESGFRPRKPNAVAVVLALLKHPDLRLNIETTGREWNYTPFMAVCKYGNIQVAQAFLEKLDIPGANYPIYEDSRKDEETALSCAYKELIKYITDEAEHEQYTELFEYLVRHPKIRGDVIASVRIKRKSSSTRTCHIIEHVIIRGETHLFRAMLPRLRIDLVVGYDGWYPLDLACRYKRIGILMLILTHPHVNLTLGNPFQEALTRGHGIRGSSWKIIQILLEQQQFTPEQVNHISEEDRGCTPLMTAVDQKLYIATELLLADTRTNVNAVINTEDDFYHRAWLGYSALMIACDSGEVRMVQLLLKHPHVDVDVKDVEGNTALHLVARHPNARCLNALIDYFENRSPERKGQRLNVQNKRGQTALDIARDGGKNTLTSAAILRENGGHVGIPIAEQRELSKRKAWRGLTRRLYKKPLPGGVAGLIGKFVGTHVVETPPLKF